MLEQEIAVQAARRLNDVVQQIQDDQWAMIMPADFKTRSDEPTSLKETINYHAYDDAWIPDMLAGHTMAEVGADKWQGDLLGTSPKQAFAGFVDAACAAIDGLSEPERTVHCSFGDYTAQQYLWQVCLFRGLRCYDLSKALGLDRSLPDDFATGLLTIIEPNAEEWRAYGVLDPAIDVADDAPVQQRLLGLCGYR